MRRLILLCLVLAACEKDDPLFCGKHPTECMAIIDGGGSNDGDVDAPDDGPPRLCFGAADYSVCLTTPPTAPVTFTAGTMIDTGAGMCLANQPADWKAAGQPDACFIIGTTINLPSVTVTGLRPLVLLASNTLNVTGTLDVSSRRTASRVGPGVPGPGCADFAGAPGADVDGAGGGAGASFQSKGGDGGDGRVTNKGLAAPQDQTAPTKLRAGCSGQAGGEGQGAGTGAAAGAGGGSVYLLAGNTITLGASAIVNASGAGAAACGREAGGGGGGSGGVIVLYATAINATAGAILVANGGGGSSGGNNGGGAAGNDPDPLNPLTPAPTVAGPGGAGPGGAGAGGPSSAQPGGTGGNNLGGGGGGGGRGYIQANVNNIANLTSSPTVTFIP